MDKRAWRFLLPLIFAPPVFISAQDCCAPGGGLTALIAKDASGGGRLVFPRRYRIRKHHPGIDAGVEAGFADTSDAKTSLVTPRFEYNGVLGDFDFYGAAFYTAASGHPVSQQADFAENIGYTLNLPGVSALTFRLDNEDIITLGPEDTAFVYGTAEPGVVYGKQFDFGGFSVEIGLPMVYKPDFRLGSYATLGYEHSSGFKTGITASLAIIPDAVYSSAALTVTYAHELFYGTIAISTDKEFKTCGIRPYAEFFIKRVTIWAGADFGGLETDKITVHPFVGGKYNF
jgi:hypothetical protein